MSIHMQQQESGYALAALEALHVLSRPSVLTGVASIVDLSGQSRYPGYGHSAAESDARALLSDGLIVGQDFWRAIEQFKRQVSHDPNQQTLFEIEEIRS